MPFAAACRSIRSRRTRPARSSATCSIARLRATRTSRWCSSPRRTAAPWRTSRPRCARSSARVVGRRHRGLGARRRPRGRGDSRQCQLCAGRCSRRADRDTGALRRPLRRRPTRELAASPLAAASRRRTLVLVADPFSSPLDGFLDSLTARPIPTSPSSAAWPRPRGPGRQPARARRTSVHRRRGRRLLIRPHRTARVVSQGCRPIGQPLTVTKSEGNVIYELAGEPRPRTPGRGLLDLLEPTTARWRRTGSTSAASSTSTRADFDRGDFLIRNVLGGDREVGAIAVGDEVEVGATVQFQVRDAVSADDDLRELLTGVAADGALVFTCNGRGMQLFGEPDHDADRRRGTRSTARPPGCSAPASSARSATAASCTASPRRSRSSAE